MTSIICKILEHVIHSSIITQFEKHGILTDSQHPKELTTNDAVRLDFSKAFDKVLHQLLLLKLKHYGIRGNLLGWIEDFLSTRTQEVVIGQKSSLLQSRQESLRAQSWAHSCSLPIPNDMPECFTSNIRLFADDCLLYRKVRQSSDYLELQQDLDRFQQLEQKWHLAFNAEKCEVLRIKQTTTNLLRLLHT